jgi:hypothetical protein
MYSDTETETHNAMNDPGAAPLLYVGRRLRQLGGAINVAVISGQQEHLP